MIPVSALGKVLIISPHLDDAVFSCAELIARKTNTIVLTIFAAIPSEHRKLTAWDAAAGFQSSHEAVIKRREEDKRALELLDATPLWLNFFDSQYDDAPSEKQLSESLHSILEQHDPDSVLFPAGLFHTDHQMTHDATLQVREWRPDCNWLAYEDSPYRRIPGLMQERLNQLLQQGIYATPTSFDTRGQLDRKRHAVQCYVSQLRALVKVNENGYTDLFTPEVYWNLTPHSSTNPQHSDKNLK